jgi:hypothetical protein
MKTNVLRNSLAVIAMGISASALAKDDGKVALVCHFDADNLGQSITVTFVIDEKAGWTVSPTSYIRKDKIDGDPVTITINRMSGIALFAFDNSSTYRQSTPCEKTSTSAPKF